MCTADTSITKCPWSVLPQTVLGQAAPTSLAYPSVHDGRVTTQIHKHHVLAGGRGYSCGCALKKVPQVVLA